MPTPPRILRSLLPLIALLCTSVAWGATGRLIVQPKSLALTGLDREHGMLVTLIEPDGRQRDVTAASQFTSSAPATVTVDAKGHAKAVADGVTRIAVDYEGLTAACEVSVSNTAAPAIPSFNQDIVPILTRTGCNAGNCHGKQTGQNGFRLSLRGYAPEWDHGWITNEVSGRRINMAFPEESLLVQKPAGDVLHEGGLRFKRDSRYYRTLIDWIIARAPGPVADEPGATKLEVLPGDRELRAGDKQQLLARAIYADGRVRDVTWLAQFFSNDETIVAVKPDGMAKALRSGETSVRVHFQGQVAVVRLTIPIDRPVAAPEFAARQNAIDEPVFKKLFALHIPPSPVCDDTTFLRRAMLDAIGTLPTPQEVRDFVADTAPDKRARLVDRLLERPEYVDFWTLQLADLLQNRKERDHDVRGPKGVRTFHAWLRGEIAANRPWDALAKEVLLATGNTGENPAVGYYVTTIGEKTNVGDSELPDSVAQSFLGTRIGCARCHNHPLEKYTQDDFYHFAAYFAKVSLKREKPENGGTDLLTITRDEQQQRRQLEIYGMRLEQAEEVARALGEEPGGEDGAKAVANVRKQQEDALKKLAEAQAKPPAVNQPRTNKMMAPQPLDHSGWEFAEGRDAREQFVDWMLGPGRDAFAGAMINRLWKHYMGIGLVEPVDDLRASNPPSNPELWALLRSEFVSHQYDLKHVMRLILNSRAYQLSAETRPENATETRYYSHYYARRLPAEVLTDAISTATQAPASFAGYPVGIKAVQLPEPGVASYFLTLFGRSDRVTACACERKGEVTLPQLLNLHNGEELQKQIQAEGGRLSGLAKAAPEEAIRSIFLATVNREPGAEESAAVMKAMATDRDGTLSDLFWALLNAKEFTFNH
jgi:hypothetical protein